MESDNRKHRVRKRAPNACARCRQQKIRCSGSVPCEQCSKRNLRCAFDSGQKKILVSRKFIADLERRAARPSSQGSQEPSFTKLNVDGSYGEFEAVQQGVEDSTRIPSSLTPGPAEITSQLQSDSEEPEQDVIDGGSTDERLENPLAPGNSASYTADLHGKPVYLGVTSNWSFGRRVLSMIHERVHGSPLPVTTLLFQGSTYDIGWDGRRATVAPGECALPTADFALFLINAVKFHCGQLFHMFDELTFMDQFHSFHGAGGDVTKAPILWYIHYLLVLAFGKVFIVRLEKSRRPPGAEYFVQAMKLLPDITFLYSEPMQSIEVLCCAALYLQCLDSRSAAYNVIGQAMRMSVERGMHTDIQSPHLADHTTERRRKVWWTVYVLDRQMSSLLGVPLALSDEDISAHLPIFIGSAHKAAALSIHVKISQATAVIMKTIYRRDGGGNNHFLKSIKEALKMLAIANDERNESFPLDLQRPAGGVSRLSAYLHLFHHQCILLATRPLLFNLWQRRLNSPAPVRVSSRGGVRSLLRVCVSSAQHTINILETLQTQSLLESFLPFDLDATFSSAVVLSLAAIVDASLSRNKAPWFQTVHALLDEMISRGNLIAKYHQSELQQLDEDHQRLSAASALSHNFGQVGQDCTQFHGSVGSGIDAMLPTFSGSSSQITPDQLGDWNSDNDLTGDQLMALADSLDFGQLDWLSMDIFGPLDPVDR